MALYSVPLSGLEMPVGACAVEVYAAECRNRMPSQPGDPDATEDDFRAAAVLVALSASEADRLTLWPLRHGLSFARCTVIGGAEWPERLAETVADKAPEFVTAVVYVGSDTELVVETVQSAIDALHRQFGSVLAAVVTVAADSERFTMIAGATGFVRGATVTTAETALHMFLVLSTFMAPESLNGIDMVDLLPILGPAEAPTVLAVAMWLRAGDGRLVCTSLQDEQAVATAQRIVAAPLIHAWGWDSVRRFRLALRSVASAASSQVVFATNGALMLGILPPSVGLVPILCAYCAK